MGSGRGPESNREPLEGFKLAGPGLRAAEPIGLSVKCWFGFQGPAPSSRHPRPLPPKRFRTGIWGRIRTRDRQGEGGQAGWTQGSGLKEENQTWQREGTRNASRVTARRRHGRQKPQDPQVESCKLFLPPDPIPAPRPWELSRSRGSL